MIDSSPIPPPDADEASPILGSWRNIYTFVLVLHAVIIVLFYLFSQAYA